MNAISHTRFISLFLFTIILQGCSTIDEWSRRYTDRWGPDTTLISDDVAITLRRQHSVMSEVKSLAYADEILPGQQGIVLTPEGWYQVAKFGLNYVDEKCDLYMHDLFVLNREHDRNDTILKTISGVSTAVIGGTLSAAKAKIPLLAVAQSFGLIEGISDAAAKSYLFEQVPGLIADKVKTARIIYRDVLDKNQKAVLDETSAFRVIRDYLSLCMPQTIEGNFLTTYAAANPTHVPATSPPASAPKKQEPVSPKVGASPPKQGEGSATLNFMVKPVLK
jgi:hypothetical protein